MRRVFNALKKIFSPLPLATIFSFLLAGVIHFASSRVQFRGFAPFRDESIRTITVWALLILGGILLLAMLFRFVVKLLEKRKAKPKREPTEEELEIAAMDGVFERALDVIRHRWSGGRSRLYYLPWYLVLGKSGAGKTTLIENSDLRFPIDHEIAAEIAPFSKHRAHNFCTWRVAGNEAVLLEIDGHEVIAHEDRSSVQKALWDRFLFNLGKARPRRPLNGIVIVVDMTEFAEMSLSAREAYALMIRRTINDLTDRLGTQMTIHIGFTKLDQVAGFVDFFENLNGAEREKLLGFHFLYEGRHTQDWLEQFDAQYSDFLQNLHLRTMQRLSQLKAVASRQEAFSFYRTYLGLEAPLRSFLESALGGDKFSTPPLVRGLYFLSSRQENPSRNTFLSAIGEKYHVPAPLYGVPQGNSFPYFVTHFFKKTVLPEAGLAGDNLRLEQRYIRRSVSMLLIGGLLLGAASLYWWDRYSDNILRAKSVLHQAREFEGVLIKDFDPTGAELLGPMRSIREATLAFGNYRQVSPIYRTATLYKGQVIGPIADATYSSVLSERFMPTLTEGVAQRLRAICPRGSDAQLSYLRVYRMLGDVEARDDRVIDKYFRDLWQRSFEADATKQEELQGHLAYALEIAPQGYAVDSDLVRSAQEDLGALTPYRRVYSGLRSLAQRQLPNALEFRATVGAEFDIVYRQRDLETTDTTDDASTHDVCGVTTEIPISSATFEIPRFFTSEEFKEFFVPQIRQVVRVAADDLWVLGIEDDTNYSEEDYEAIAQNIRDLYVEDYTSTWRNALNALEIRDFQDIRDATEILRAVSGGDAPIPRIAALVTRNTTIYEPETDLLTGEEPAASTNLPQDPDRRAGLAIAEGFSDIHRMLDSEAEGTRPNIDQIQQALTAVYEYMKAIRDAPEPNAKALEMAIARVKMQDDDPIYLLERIATRTPAPFGPHLQKIADESWRIVMEGATDELNRKWNQDIYGSYQILIAGKYPFDRSSEIDLPLDDFRSFFEPGGTLESFYTEELLTFVEESTGEPRVIDGQSLAVDPGFASALRSAIEISQVFFNSEGDLSVQFTVQPVGMSANLGRAIVDFEGQVVVSTHSASRPARIVWPNIIDGPRSSRYSVSPLVNAGSSASSQYDGPWSWLRLYDNASKRGIDNNSVDLVFSTPSGQSAIFRVRSEGQVNPFFNSPLSSFSLPRYMRTPTEGASE